MAEGLAAFAAPAGETTAAAFAALRDEILAELCGLTEAPFGRARDEGRKALPRVTYSDLQSAIWGHLRRTASGWGSLIAPPKATRGAGDAARRRIGASIFIDL